MFVDRYLTNEKFLKVLVNDDNIVFNHLKSTVFFPFTEKIWTYEVSEGLQWY